MENIFLYQKPLELCSDLTEREQFLLKLSDEEFIREYKKDIERKIEENGYKLRGTTVHDILALDEFGIRNQPRKDIPHWVSVYDLYRFIEFGQGIIVESADKKMIGSAFEIGYNTPDKTSYSIRLVVDKECRMQGLGILIAVYTCLLAMERGSRIKRAYIDYFNHTSAYLNMNKLGWMVDGIVAKLEGLRPQIPSLTYCAPITKKGLLCNRFDHKKALEFIKTKQKDKDYKLLSVTNIDELTDCYTKTNFRIIGFIKNDETTNNYYFAVPAQTIHFNERIIIY